MKGAYLKKYQYNITALTECAFLLSQKFLGDHYDKEALENNLNAIAKKVIKRKGFVLENEAAIAYSDILLYENGFKVLYKPYTEYVKPLEKKIKENRLTHKDAYRFVYEEATPHKAVRQDSGKQKKVAPLYRLVVFLHIPRNTKRMTEIVTLQQLRVGSAKVEKFELSDPTVPFRITNKGSVVLSSSLKEDVYNFEVIAHTKDGDSNKISFTIIIDKPKDSQFYKIEQ